MHLFKNIGADDSLVMGSTADTWPYCGKVPGQENHFVLAGYNGSGMGLAFLVAKGIAKMLRENAPFEETGIPRVFEATGERLMQDVTRL